MPSVDMQLAYRSFKQYVSNYNPEDPKIALKVSHIVRVARKSRILAERLGLSPDEVALAELIGLLHDIGRFEQIAQYDTFKDADSVNHGFLGCQILFGPTGIIRSFAPSSKDDEIIYSAVINHNRAGIENPDSMTERELLHSKIIRDTDKLDIFKVQLEEPNIALYGHEGISDDVLTPAVYEDFCREKLIDYRLRSGSAPDAIMCAFGYVYDINFPASLAMALEDGYLARLGSIPFNDAYTAEKLADGCARALAYCHHASDPSDSPE